jgi:guanine deaminase
MDRNCPEYLKEDNASTGTTREWLETFYKSQQEGRYKNTAPILTPRFIPSCSDELMRRLREIQREYGLPVQSHLSENREEVEWVRALCPGSQNYAAAYADAGLLGGDVPTIMAHCVWSDEVEMKLLSEKKVYIAHCPQSNINLASGIAPVRRFIEQAIPLGLGSDVAGGSHSSIFRAMSDAIQVSKLRKTLIKAEEKALTLEEVFYLGTIGGGSFFKSIGFGRAGSFEPGWDFDALVIDDSTLALPARQKIRDRLERVVYLSDDRHIKEKYVLGVPLF